MIRPTVSSSSIVAAVLGLGTLALLGWHADLLAAVAVATVAATAFVVAGLLGTRGEGPTIVVSSVCYVAAAALALATVGVALLPVFEGLSAVESSAEFAELANAAWYTLLFAVGAALAAFGAFSLPRQRTVPAASRAIVDTATLTTGVALVATTVVLAGWLLEGAAPVETLLEEVEPVREGLFEPDDVVPQPGVVLLLAAAAGFPAGALLGSLPIPVFVSRDRRDGVEAAIERVQRWSLRASVLALILGPMVMAVPPETWLEVRDHLPEALYDGLLTVTTSGFLRVALVRLAVLSAVSLVVIGLTKRIRLEFFRGPARYLARGAGGGVVLAVVLAIGPGSIVERVGQELPEEAAPILEEVVLEFGATLPVLMSVLVAFAVVWAVVVLFALLGLLRLVPPRTASAVLTAIGIATASIAAGLLAGPSPLLFGTLAAAVVAWDVGSYDRRLRTEVGEGARTRRAELVHVGSTLTVGVIAAAVVYWLATVVPETVAAGGIVSASLTSLLGVILLLSALRG